MSKDFTKKQFSHSLRGYSPDDVDKYLQFINGEFVKLERHSAESDRKLIFALRKLESLTTELQKIYSAADSSGVVQDAEGETERTAPSSAEIRKAEADLENAKKELEEVRAETEKISAAAEEKARALLSAARTRGDSIILEAQTKADSIVADSARKARSAAEQIITDAALASRKIIRDAEAKADEAVRDLMNVYTAADEMYKEVSGFRGNLFSLYDGHIKSIESISASAHGMIDTVNGIVRELEEGPTEQTKNTALPVTEKTEPQPVPEPEPAMFREPVTAPLADDEDDDPLPDLYINVGDEDGEYYDSFDEIPDEDEIDFDESRAEKPEETPDEDETLPWDDDPLEEAPADIEATDDVVAEEALSDEESDTEEYGEDTEDAEDITEENDPDENDEESPKEDEPDDYSDDFDIPDDVSSGTNVLDIVKKLGEGQKPEKSADESDFLDISALLADDGVSADEFRRAFSDDKEASDIGEIMRQPIDPPNVPTKPKKHSKF